MASICPQDFRPCPDDMCRGSGVCMASGAELFELCAVCRKVYSREYDIDCDCERVDEDAFYDGVGE